jgi:muramidase (phage lysozyme)
MSDGISPNARRWLNTIAFAEGTWGGSGPRYDVTFGYTPIKDLSRHPDRVVHGGKYSSAAAGAYQFMPTTWARAQKALGLKDFGPQSQDLAALQLLRWRGVDPDKDPITRENVAKVAGEWASLPTIEGRSAYGQPVKSFEALQKFAESQGTIGSAKAEAPKTSGKSGRSLLETFIDLMGVTGGRFLGPQSAVPNPEMPDYSEGGFSPEQQELDLVLNAYKGQQEQDAYSQALAADSARQMQTNVAAAEQAKAKLLTQALSAFATPTSTL